MRRSRKKIFFEHFALYGRCLGICLLIGLLGACRPSPLRADELMAKTGLGPENILVLYNQSNRDSRNLAEYYAQQRGIEPDQLLGLLSTDQERVSREDYNRFVAGPVRKTLKDRPEMKVLVVLYGLPLKISPTALTQRESIQKRDLEKQLTQLEGRLAQAPDDQKGNLEAKRAALRTRMEKFDRRDEEAALDSELALVKVSEYPLAGWLLNPHYSKNARRLMRYLAEDVLLVSRLDAPEPAMVRRIINDSIEVEQQGLSGTAYLDARWPDPDPKNKLSGYALYDHSLHQASRLLKAWNWPVILDDKQTLFPEQLQLKAALYCGWYSLARYVDTFVWQQGAIGYHIASSECSTLKRPGSEVWCKRMLEEGIAATLGPVSEPYVQAFPLPELFFDSLLEGNTLVEAYFASLPHVSWKMVLVGDPLYRPFKEKAKK